jgi:hypothetical protein
MDFGAQGGKTFAPAMVDPDITAGDWVYVQRRNIPGVPLKEGGRGKVPPSREPVTVPPFACERPTAIIAELGEAVFY